MFIFFTDAIFNPQNHIIFILQPHICKSFITLQKMHYCKKYLFKYIKHMFDKIITQHMGFSNRIFKKCFGHSVQFYVLQNKRQLTQIT